MEVSPSVNYELCRKLFFKRTVACFPRNNVCGEVSLSTKIIAWSFDMVLSNVNANIASLVGLEFDDWRAIVYQYRIFKNVLVLVRCLLKPFYVWNATVQI